MAPLARTTLREEALKSLRTAITGGVIPPGGRLVETELSAALGVSRGTLREALRSLQQEGLVTSHHGRLTVRRVSATEVREIFSVRAALEALATRELCSRPDRQELVGRLETFLTAMEDTRGNLADQAEADLAFHHELCRLTGNDTLVHAWEFLSGHVRVTIMHAGPERALHNMNVDRHRPLLDALLEGDAGAAAGFVERHMAEAVERLTRTEDPPEDTVPPSAGRSAAGS
ncbi:GntR family transcriptional regulator [Phycicoccus sp. CMS6Z-2]|nr:GntR family transcriptional regulator [Phycicoccus flavus]